MQTLKFDPRHGCDDPRVRVQLIRSEHERRVRSVWDRHAAIEARYYRRIEAILGFVSLIGSLIVVALLIWYLVRVGAL